VKVHLVGSIGLATVEDVFSTVGTLLADHLERVPDGEPGGRRVWISWQYPVFLANPFLQIDRQHMPEGRGPGLPRFRIADGVQAEEVQFGELGYAREARASYQDFVQARDRGLFKPGTRFQVCIPTPLNVIAYACSSAETALAVEPAYEAAMRAEVARLCAAIPHDDLCIQWDMVREIIWLDGQVAETQPPLFQDVKAGSVDRLRRISSDIPASVQLGFHICYGDWGGRHHVQPRDTGAMVDLANAIAAGVGRRVDYFHMPVPIDRNDAGFFAPLAGLALPPETEIYLGLVHMADGGAGTRTRMNAARQYLPKFGIATECGLGRAKTPGTVRAILDVYAAASA
jgi:hypothetical protein